MMQQNTQPPMDGSRTSSVEAMIRIALNIIQNPAAFVTLFFSGIGGKMAYTGGTMPDALDLFIYFIILLFVIAGIKFLVWALPQTYHIFVQGITCAVFSWLAMGWCMNNEAKCRDYFVITTNKIDQTVFALKELIFKII
jgi:hypothetical protein